MVAYGDLDSFILIHYALRWNYGCGLVTELEPPSVEGSMVVYLLNNKLNMNIPNSLRLPV